MLGPVPVLEPVPVLGPWLVHELVLELVLVHGLWHVLVLPIEAAFALPAFFSLLAATAATAPVVVFWLAFSAWAWPASSAVPILAC